MPTMIKSGNEIQQPLRDALADARFPAGTRQNGTPTVLEYRFRLPSDEKARALVEQAMLGALEMASAISPGSGANSNFVADTLRQVFETIPKKNADLDVMMQIASIPIHTTLSSTSYSTGVGYLSNTQAKVAE